MLANEGLRGFPGEPTSVLIYGYGRRLNGIEQIRKRWEKREGGLSGREVCHDGRDKEMGGTLKERKKAGWNEKEMKGRRRKQAGEVDEGQRWIANCEKDGGGAGCLNFDVNRICKKEKHNCGVGHPWLRNSSINIQNEYNNQLQRKKKKWLQFYTESPIPA